MGRVSRRCEGSVVSKIFREPVLVAAAAFTVIVLAVGAAYVVRPLGPKPVPVPGGPAQGTFEPVSPDIAPRP